MLNSYEREILDGVIVVKIGMYSLTETHHNKGKGGGGSERW